MTDLEKHAEAIKDAIGTIRHWETEEQRKARIDAAIAALFDAGALAMREAAVDVCSQYRAFCGDQPLWPDEPETTISIITPASIREAHP